MPLLRTPCRVSPFPATLTQTPGMGVPQHLRATLCFRRHMRHVAPLSPVASLDCAYFLSPRGCTLCALLVSLRLWQTQLARPLFSYSYELLFPQPLLFHIHTNPPGVWGDRSSRFNASLLGSYSAGVFLRNEKPMTDNCELEKEEKGPEPGVQPVPGVG